MRTEWINHRTHVLNQLNSPLISKATGHNVQCCNIVYLTIDFYAYRLY